ncbi:MAG: hypothetical protein AAFZ15_07955 [Bacteroidota bacterium]
MKTIISLLFTFWICLFVSIAGQAQADSTLVKVATQKTIFEHLQQDDLLEVTLESNFKDIVKYKKKNNYQPAVMTIKKADGTEEVWQTEIRPRGNIRRVVCEIPPIKMRFDEDELAAKGLDKRRTLKMVILCRNGKGYEQLVLREYLCYKLYNLITDQSFQVQLAKIKYVDTRDSKKAFNESFAFFIEHPKNLADRTEAEILENQKFGSSLMNTDAGERFAMFQFMIGNTDWYFFNSHNVKVCGIPGTADLIPLPYDFDYSGLVKTPYAVPHDKLDITSVTERYYQGYCRDKEQTMKTIQLFLDKKEAIMDLANNFPHFAKYSRKSVRKYLKKFFDIIESSKLTKREILRHCDKWPLR